MESLGNSEGYEVKQADQEVRDQTVDDIQALPTDVLDRFRPSQLEQFANGCEGPLHYYAGPVAERMQFVALHPEGHPSRWMVKLEDARESPLTDTVRDLGHAELGKTLPTEVSSSLDRYLNDPRSELYEVDLYEKWAVIPEFDEHLDPDTGTKSYLPRDTATEVDIPQGVYAEYIESTTAPQISDLDSQTRTSPFWGGGEQIYLLDFDRELATTRQSRLGPESVRPRRP